MKKNDEFSRKSTPFLKSACLALCLVSFGGTAAYAESSYATHTMLTVQMNGKSIKDDFEALNYWLVPLIYDGVLLKWLQQVGEEEGMALVKQIEISKDRSETAQATIKRLLLELDLLN